MSNASDGERLVEGFGTEVTSVEDEIALGAASGLPAEHLAVLHAVDKPRIDSILNRPEVALRQRHYRERMMLEGSRVHGRYLLMLESAFNAVRDALHPQAPLKIRAENAWKVIDRVDPPVQRQEINATTHHTISAESASKLTVAFQGLRQDLAGVKIEDEQHMIEAGGKGNGSAD